MKRKKWLAVAVLGTIMTLQLSTPVCAAADRAAEEAETRSGALDQYDIGDMVVTAHRDAGEAFVAREGTVGILGTQDTMDTPFTVTNITEKTVESFTNPTQPLDSMLAGSPSIRQSGSILHNDFTFRGFRANGTSCYVNGIPGIWTQFNAPTLPGRR